jgi:hypothetical protein
MFMTMNIEKIGENSLFSLEERLSFALQKIVENDKIITQNNHLILDLQNQIAVLQRALYGKRSEKFKPDPEGAKLLFNEAEAACDGDHNSEEPESEIDSVSVKPHDRKRGKRKPLPDKLPRVRNEIDLPDSDKFCNLHGTPLE